MYVRFSTLISLLMVVGCATAAHAQTGLTGTSVPDNQSPQMIAVPTQGSVYQVLNYDLSVMSLSSLAPGSTVSCPTPPGLIRSTQVPTTLLNDDTNYYVTSQGTGGSAAALSAVEPSFHCATAVAQSIPGPLPAQTLTSNDPGHGRFYVVSGFSGQGIDTLTVYNNLNTNSTSTPTLTQEARVGLDTGAIYTSAVTDVHSSYGLTAITERKSNGSPGNLWVYSSGIKTAFKILGPGGVPLPAVNAFIIPAANNANGDLLVLVNQDNLTSANLSSPPVDTTPFTIIDLGQLQRAFSAVVANGNTITLPAVTQIHATTPYFGMLGAAYNPVFHLIYALVANGPSAASSSGVTQSIIRYDPTNPSAPAETVVADASVVPYNFGDFPQLALNAAAGTMDILPPTPSSLYHVGIAGHGNTAFAVTGAPFPDNDFKPIYVASNTLLGETYIASNNGLIDILTRPATSLPRATIELYGFDTAIAGQPYTLTATVTSPISDPSLNSAAVTFTATPSNGAAFTLASGTVGNLHGTNSFVNATFPAAGVYTIVASVPSTTMFPAFTSLPLTVTVGATGDTGVYPTSLALSVPAASPASPVNATVTLSGSTYAPTGRIVVNDSSGNEVGRFTFAGAVLSNPITISLQLPTGSSTLTAVYNGDDQNQGSTSPSKTISIGTIAKVTPALAIVVPTTATVGSTVRGTLSFTSTSTTAPTGNITVYEVPATGPPVTIATIASASAYATGGAAVSFVAPAAGAYTIFASYDGDSAYNLAYSPTYNLTTTTGVTKGTIAFGLSIETTGSSGVISAGSVTTSLTGNTATPTGTVTITAQSANTGTITLASFPAANAKTTLITLIRFTMPASGTYAVTANYPGDTNFNASSSDVSTLVVTTPGPTTTTSAISAASSVTALTNFAATVSLVPKSIPTAPPTGNVVVTGTSAGVTIVYATLPATQAIVAGGTQATINLPTTGAYTLTTTYAGDANYGPSTASIGVTVNPIATNLRVLDPGAQIAGTSFKVPIEYSSGTTYTGTITLSAQLSGSSAPATTLTGAFGSNFPLILTTAGTYTLVATYAGDALHAPSTSNSVIIVVSNPASGSTFFTMTMDDPSLKNSPLKAKIETDPGVVATTGMTLTSFGGYNTPVNLTALFDNNQGAGNTGKPGYTVTFADPAGKLITSAIPTASGTHVTIVFAQIFTTLYVGKAETPARQTPHTRGVPGPALAFGFAGFALLAIRKKNRRLRRSLQLLCISLVILLGSLTIQGCNADLHDFPVVITGTPAASSQPAPVQVVTFEFLGNNI